MGFVVQRGAVGAGTDHDSQGAPLTVHWAHFETYKVLSSLGINGVGEIRPC